MSDKVYKYIKFLPKTGMFRSNTIAKLKDLGVIKMPRFFLGTSDVDLSNVYGLIVSENSDLNVLDEFMEDKHQDVVKYIPLETIKEYNEKYLKLEIYQGDTVELSL